MVEDTKRAMSPTPNKVEKTKDLNFYEALKAIMGGKSVTKIEWGNRNIYGILKDTHIMLHKADNRYYDWILSDGDVYGEDWVIL